MSFDVTVVAPPALKFRWFVFLLTLLVACTTQAVELPIILDPETGEPWTGEPGIHEKNEHVEAREKEHGRSARPHRHQPLHRLDAQNLLADPNSADTPIFSGGDTSSTGPNVAGITAQTVATSFTGATLNDTRAFPPDSMGAVGPSQYIVAVNGRIRSFNKSTGIADGVLDADTDVFFNSVMTPPTVNNFTSDPRIRYDRLSGRWFVLIIDVPGAAGTLPNRIMIAVSDGGVITANTTWTFYQFQHDLVAPAGDSGKFADYPTLGIDANALYIGVNIFNTSGLGSFYNTTGFVVRKSSVLNGGPIVVTAFRKLISNAGTGPYTPQGVDNYSPTATEGYFIGVDSSRYGRLDLRRVSNPGGTPSISGNVTITVALNGGTITVPHLGNTGGVSGELDGLDYRLLGAHLRNGRLWTAGNIGLDNTGSPSGTDTRMGVRWYELQNIATGQTPGVVQSGTLFQSSAGNTADQRSYWMGTVMVSGQGHAAMGFSVAGANEYINAGTCGRLAGDALGTMRAPLLYTTANAAYNPASDTGGSGGRRWGDYSYTCVDPSDDMTMWTIQEFCNAQDSYGVRVAKLLAPGPAAPAVCSPSFVTNGMSNIIVVVTGTSDGDTGFFDPGAGFSNRIAAAISGGGVTVNSVTFSNSTHVRLNLSVAGAAIAGARTITVTNPDGQSATSVTGLLTVIAGTNSPPGISPITEATILEQTPLAFTVTASDPDGNALTFSLTNAPAGAAINSTNGVFSWTPDEAQGPGTNQITVIVTDNGTPALMATQTFTIVVLESNRPPFLSPISEQAIYEETTLTVTNFATDPDIPANALTFSLDSNTAPAGAEINPTNGVFTWTPDEAQGPGTNQITVIVTDDGNPPLMATRTFAVVILESNRPPVLSPIEGQTITEETTLTITNVATDPDLPANVLIFSLDTNSAPAGAEINPTNGVFTWTPNESQGPGTNQITVVVTDNGVPSLIATQTFTVVVLESNRPPVLAAIPDRVIYAETILTITNSATDPDWPLNALTYELETNSAPPGAAINAISGVFTWTPGEAQLGTNTFTITVADDGQPALTDSKTFNVTVVARPVIVSVNMVGDKVTVIWSAIAGKTYRVQYKDDLEAVAWTDLSPDVTASGQAASVTDSISSSAQRFYRVMVLP
jgi:hypothetical protein